jgi:beta-lactamase regulating signal transducer with metallopeptidase domain
MNNFLPYLLKSTICLTLLYLVFRIVMRKEHFFSLTRMLLLTIVLLSATIPLIQLTLLIQSPIQVNLPSVFTPVEAVNEAIPPANSRLTESVSTEIPSNPTVVISQVGPSIPQLLLYGYLAGCLIAMLILLRGLVSVLLLTRKARSIPMEGFRLLVVEWDIPACQQQD